MVLVEATRTGQLDTLAPDLDVRRRSVAPSKSLTILVQLAGTWDDVFAEPKCSDSAAALDCANKSVYLTAEPTIFLECFLDF